MIIQHVYIYSMLYLFYFMRYHYYLRLNLKIENNLSTNNVFTVKTVKCKLLSDFDQSIYLFYLGD